MREYHLIDKDRAYDSAEILTAINNIPEILMENVNCSREIQSITGDVFRTDADRDRALTSVEAGEKFKDTYFSILEKYVGKGEELRRNLDMAVNIANTYKESCSNKILRNSLLKFIEEKPYTEMLKAIKGINAAVHCYNILLCDLLLGQMELTRLKSPEGKTETRTLWWHSGQQVSLPYAVSGLMLNTYVNNVHSVIDDAAMLIFGSEYKFFIDSVKNSPADICEVYSNYTAEEIEHEAEKFTLKGLVLPDQDMIEQAILSILSAEDLIASEEIMKKYGYTENDLADCEDIELE
ncbi:MAG: hypothetical protein EOM59_17300 [Clostridia bacterium]|nr:hypothetical protein [Clostridia bacterium]NCD04327.1 hypothetical protein [Clostridia bacterium]